MTIPAERTRSLLHAGGFLVELARNESLPLSIRQRAAAIARHFPTIEDLHHMSVPPGPLHLEAKLTPPDCEDESGCGEFGPLRYSTRISWPGASRNG